MNDLDLPMTTQGSRREVVSAGGDMYDVFGDYGAKAQDGTFLSFSRVGEFEAGQDKEQVPFGTRVIANMPGLRQGWRCWIGGKVVDDRTELLVSRIPQQRRNELGDMDQGLWERDKEGKPRDPWVETDILEMRGDGANYIFSTTSKGGRGAIQRLCAAFNKAGRMRPGMLPIITLERDSYPHKEYGKTYFPVFEIVGWADADILSLAGADQPSQAAITDKRAAKADSDDTIPFEEPTPIRVAAQPAASRSRQATRF